MLRRYTEYETLLPSYFASIESPSRGCTDMEDLKEMGSSEDRTADLEPRMAFAVQTEPQNEGHLGYLPPNYWRSVDSLTRLLADTMTISYLYEKHQEMLLDIRLYKLYKLFDEHRRQQRELAKTVLERLRWLGQTPDTDMDNETALDKDDFRPSGSPNVARQISQLITAHRTILHMSNPITQSPVSMADGCDKVVKELCELNELQILNIINFIASGELRSTLSDLTSLPGSVVN